MRVKLQCNQVVGSQQPSMTYYEEEAGRRGGGASPIIIRRAPQPRLGESVWKLKAPKQSSETDRSALATLMKRRPLTQN